MATSVAGKLSRAVRAAIEVAQPQEQRLQERYKTEIRRVGRNAASRFTQLTSLQAAASWSPPTVADVLAVAAQTERITRAQRAMLSAVGGVIGDIEGVDFSLTHPIVQRLLDKLGAKVPGTITQAAREPVAHAIARSWAEGASVPDTAAAIRDGVYGVAEFKATMLARTDLIGMSNGGAQWAAHQLNDASVQAGEPAPIQTKTWLSSHDDRVRPSHEEADGQTVPVGDPYQVGDATLQYPGDPDGPDEEVINCRCTELYNEDSGEGGASPGGEDVVASALGRRPGLVAAARSVRRRGVRFRDQQKEETMSGTMIVEGGVVRDSRLRARASAVLIADAAGRGWTSDIAFEGVSTGDGRYMVDGSLGWREPPLTLMAMLETPDFGGHAGAQVAGRMDSFSKRTTSMDGAVLPAGVTAVYSEGVFDVGDVGVEVERLVGDETLRGISIDLAINEWGFRDPDTGEILDPDEMTPQEWDRAFMGDLDFAVIDGTIMAATVCPTPAFEDARIALLASSVLRPRVWRAGNEYATQHAVKPDQLMTTLTAAMTVLTAGAIAAKSTDVVDETWDAGAQEKKLNTPVTGPVGKAMYAWYDGNGADPDGDGYPDAKADWKFPHHMVDAGGTPGAANINGVDNAKARLSGSSIPEGDKAGVERHLQRHQDDWKASQASMTAAGGIAPLAPPSAWFRRPEATEPTPLTVTDDGSIYGHIALWETCHTGFINGEWAQCITPPRSRTGYARFHVGEIMTREGEPLPIGKLTVGCGHAPMSASPKQVRDHYDNTGSVGAFVRALDGKHGVWVCGATRSDMTAEQLRDLRANPPSGDWRAVDHHLELHAALAVPVPGFPVTRSQLALAASADGGVEIVTLILVASAEQKEAPEVTLSADVLAALIEGGGAGLDDLIAA